MTKIALLTCDKLPDLKPSDQQLIPELKKYNITAQAAIWDNPKEDWTQFDYLVFRNTWDYYEKEELFNQWLSKIEHLGIPTLNPLNVIQQNKHKFYLQELEQKGITILPTYFQKKTVHLDLTNSIPTHWKKMVIKPAFSAGSYLTKVFEPIEIEQIEKEYQIIAQEKELLLQEFQSEITTLGETSFIFFNKSFSHAVNKRPAANDFRIQVQFGGQYTLVHPSESLIQQAQEIVNQFPEPLLYARVDGIVKNNTIHLMEVECIEPDLYFDYAPNALQKFTQAIVQLIQ